MEVFFKMTPYLCLLLVGILVHPSEQSDPEDKFLRLENLINDKFTAMDGEFAKIWDKLIKIEDDVHTVSGRATEDAGELKASVHDIKNQLGDLKTQENEIKEDIKSLNAPLEEIRNGNTELVVFNETGVTVHKGEAAHLSCAVVGEFENCHWRHNGIIYEIKDIKNGTYIDIEASPNVHQDQCGIVLPAVKKAQEGTWSCHIYASGHYLSNSRNITIEASQYDTDMDCFSVGQECFYVERDVLQTKSWDEARNYCKDKGGDLVSPNDFNALLFFLKVMGWDDNAYWVGATDAEDEGTWGWLDGTLLTYVWGMGEPNDGRKHNCAYIYGPNGLLYDGRCSTQMYFICEQ